MCGILFVSAREGRNAVKPTLRRWRKQKHRGSEGFGYVTIDQNNKIGEVMRATTGTEIEKMLRQETAKHIMFHHRMPTSTPNYVEATHPLVVQWNKLDHDYYIVHNGVISNWQETFEKYKTEGYVFRTEFHQYKAEEFVNSKKVYSEDPEIKINDSESFAIDLAMFLDGKKDAIESVGSIAFIAIQTDKNSYVKKIFWGHNYRNPLLLEQDNTVFALRSMGGSSKDVKTDVLFSLEWDTGEIIEKSINIGYGFAVDKTKGSNDWERYWPKEKTTGFNTAKTKEIDQGITRFLDPNYPMLPDGMVASPIKTKDMWEREREQPAEDYSDDYDYDFLEERGADEPSIIEIFGGDDDAQKKLMQEIVEMSEYKQGDPDHIRTLRSELRNALYDYARSQNEYHDAILLIKESKGDNYDHREKDAAWGLLEAARADVADCRKNVDATAAELTAWISSEKW